jgi:biopolymer transport protein ExbD
MRVKFEDEETVEVQMAPLIDCVFLLLIFFLVGTTLYLDSNLVGQGFLAKKLHELAAQDPAHRIRIDADRDAPMWSAVQILDICNFENLKNVGIRTKQVTEPNYRAQ